MSGWGSTLPSRLGNELIPADAPELAGLRSEAPSSPVWALVAEHPECVVIVAWYD